MIHEITRKFFVNFVYFVDRINAFRPEACPSQSLPVSIKHQKETGANSGARFRGATWCSY